MLLPSENRNSGALDLDNVELDNDGVCRIARSALVRVFDDVSREAGSVQKMFGLGRNRLLLIALGLCALGPRGNAAWLDQVSDSLLWGPPDGAWQIQASAVLDLELHYIDGYPPGLVFADDGTLINPRLTLFFDGFLGDPIYAFAKLRADRGLDPGYHPPGQIRVDEYFVRLSAPGGGLHVQAGRFATVFGNWAGRHDSWENPFVNAPIPYERVTAALDGIARSGPAAFLQIQKFPDRKDRWVPVIWGPVYTAGAGVFGKHGKFDAAVTMKNAALSSRPPAWSDFDFSRPTFTGRFGYVPNEVWRMGISASKGPYLLAMAAPTLPPERSIDDFDQVTIGGDLAWSRGPLQIWGEVIASKFEVPNVGGAGTLSYYLESRYKWHPRLFTAVRWGQQFFDRIDNGSGGRERWDRGVSRIDFAVTYRFDRHFQVKVQYSLSNQYGNQEQGRHYAATQVTMRF